MRAVNLTLAILISFILASSTDAEILKMLKDYEAVDAESFYVGAMEGKAVRALESTFGLVGSMTAFSKAQFKRLVAKSKKEKI